MRTLNTGLILRLGTAVFLTGISFFLHPNPVTVLLTLLLCVLSSQAVLNAQSLLALLWLPVYWSVYKVSPGFPDEGEAFFRALQAVVMILLLMFRVPLAALPLRARRFSREAAAALLVLAVCLAAVCVFRKFPLSWCGWAAVLLIYAYQVDRIPVSPLLRTAVALLFSAVIMFAVLEAGTRLLLPITQKPGGLFDLDEEAIFVLRPGATAEYSFLDNSGKKTDWTVAISPQGIRDRVYGPKSPDEFRILTLGDSFTMGQPLGNPEETFQRELERMLNEGKTSKHITVINGGVTGYAPWQERLFLRDHGFGFEPDLVVLQLFPGNDVAGSYNKVGKYLQAFDAQWEQIVINFKRQQEYPFYAERWCQAHSNLYRLFCSMSASADLIARIVANLRMVPKSNMTPLMPVNDRSPYHELCLVNWYPELHEAWSIFEESVRGIRDDCREHGIPLLAFANGHFTSLDPAFWKEMAQALPNHPFEMNKDLRLAKEMLTRLGIPHPDVLAAFKAYPVPEDLYYLRDGHFTPQGARILADCLHTFIMKHLWNTGWWKYSKQE